MSRYHCWDFIGRANHVIVHFGGVPDGDHYHWKLETRLGLLRLHVDEDLNGFGIGTVYTQFEECDAMGKPLSKSLGREIDCQEDLITFKLGGKGVVLDQLRWATASARIGRVSFQEMLAGHYDRRRFDEFELEGKETTYEHIK